MPCAPLARREGEGRLVRVRDPGDRGASVALGDLLHRGEAGVQVREEVGEDPPLLGMRCTCTVDLGDDAEAALRAQDHLPHARPGRRARNGRMHEHPPGRTTRIPLMMSAMSPYLSDCMPDERVATQPPSVEWVNESGKCPSVQPCWLSWASRSGPARRPGCARVRSRRRSRLPAPGGRGRGRRSAATRRAAARGCPRCCCRRRTE